MIRSSFQFSRSTSAAFTLIELLVVLAIIAILASLLLPALSKARMQADTAICRNNSRQIGIALRLYVDDHSVYPGRGPDDDNEQQWFRGLEVYLKNEWPHGDSGVRGVFACPGYNKIHGKYLRTPWYSGGAYAYNYSDSLYTIPNRQCRGLGGFVSGGGLGTTKSVALREDRVVSPSDMIAVTDSILIGAGPDNKVLGPGYLFASHSALSDPLFIGHSDRKVLDAPRTLYHRRHNNRFNAMFVDGHVETIKVADLFDPKRPEVRRRWHFDNQP